MQGFKKSLVALLAVAMVLSLVGPVFAAPADVEGTKYEDAAVRLIALGIFKGDDKGNFNPDDPISRAEATAVVIRALGLEKSADLMNGVTKFADVNADAGLQWATGAVNVAVSSSIINGYPDGNFGGRDNVTYAQLAKMILYALNYGVTVEGGVWPTAVLAKADDLDILDGMTVVADAPITRGDAAKMLDNSLDVNALRQTGYGDLKQFEEDGKTLLERMGLDEIEGRVVEIPEVKNALDNDEVVIEVTKENGDDVTAKKETYAELEGVDVQGLFGLKVKAWINDDEIVFVEKKAQDEHVDTIKNTDDLKKNKVDLVVLDDDVTFDEDATIYVNFEKIDVDELKAGYFGRFVEDKNEIVFANLFKFEKPNGVVVTEVKGDKIRYFDTDDKERTLDLTDADAVTVYNKGLSKASLDDIEEDAVLYWWEEDDEFHIVIVDDKVEGKVTKIANTKVTIDGTAYTFNDEGTYSLDEDDTVERYTKSAKDIEDFDEEEVVALLNLKGQIRHLRTSAEATSGTQYGIVIDAPRYDEVTIFNKDGEEVTYAIDARADYRAFDEYHFFAAEKKEPYYAAVAYKINSDGEVIESATDGNVGLKHAVGVQYDNEFFSSPNNSRDQYAGKVTKKADSSKLKVDGTTFYASSSTVIMRALDEEGELDPEVIAWEDFEELYIEGKTDVDKAIVFGEAGKTAKFIVFMHEDFEGTGEDYYYAVATSDDYRSSGDWKVDLDVFDEGKDTYLVGNNNVSEGDVLEFKLNAKGEMTKVTKGTGSRVNIKDDKVVVDDGYMDVGTGSAKVTYKIDSNAVIYQLEDDRDIDRAIDAVDLEEKTVGTIEFVDDEGVIKALVYIPVAVDKDDVVTDGTVTYIDGTGEFVIIDDKEFEVVGDAVKVFEEVLEKGDKVAFNVTKEGKIYAVTAIDGRDIEVNDADVDISGITFGKNLTITKVKATSTTVTSQNVTVKGNLVVEMNSFKGKSFDVTGTTTINGNDVEFNSTLRGKVIVNATGVKLTNVTLGSDLEVKPGASVTLAGKTTIAGKLENEGTVNKGADLDAETEGKIDAAAAVAAAIEAAETAIAALPEEITLEDEAAVAAARALVDAVEELDEDAVVENIDVLEAAETKIAELEAAKAGFIAAFNAAIADIKVNDETVATAEMEEEDISVTFKTSDVDEILAGAGVVFNALRDLAADESTITINDETFTLYDSLDIPALAQAILDGKMDEFLAGNAIEADYTATVYVTEGYFTLNGSLTFILEDAQK